MEEHSFDNLAKKAADGAVSRGQALKGAGAAFLGVFGLASLPGTAEARRKKKHRPPSAILTSLWAVVKSDGSLDRGKGVQDIPAGIASVTT